MRDNLGFIASLRTRYGPLVEITLQPGTRTVIVQDPDLIRTMLTDLGPSLDKGRFFEKMGQLLGDSVVTAAGQEHVRKRRQLQPAFGRPEISRYVDIMRGETTAAVDTWAPGRQLDVREAMVKLSLDMLAKTIFSGSLDEVTFRRLREDLSVVMNGVGARVMLPDWVERLPCPSTAGSPPPGTPCGPPSPRPWPSSRTRGRTPATCFPCCCAPRTRRPAAR